MLKKVLHVRNNIGQPNEVPYVAFGYIQQLGLNFDH